MTEEARDPQLEETLERALKLRITMREIAEHTGEHEAQIWRWRTGRTKTNWERRERFLAVVEELIAKRKNEYDNV